MLATTADDEVQLYRVSDGSHLRDVGQPDSPSALLFSPSGHRLFALVGDRVTVSDRFSGQRLGAIELPTADMALRVDGTGRWLYAPTAGGDTVLVMDLATMAFTASVPGTWRDDLPLLAGRGHPVRAAAGEVLLHVVHGPLAGDPQRQVDDGRLAQLDDQWLPRVVAESGPARPTYSF